MLCYEFRDFKNQESRKMTLRNAIKNDGDHKINNLIFKIIHELLRLVLTILLQIKMFAALSINICERYAAKFKTSYD